MNSKKQRYNFIALLAVYFAANIIFVMSPTFNALQTEVFPNEPYTRILLISTHLVEQAERLANCALFLRRGELVREGALNELCCERSLEDLYREIYGAQKEGGSEPC